jgi:tRNA dimethylallyltransferase
MGKIPIIVGGTSYWIQHLMFPNRLPTPSQSLSDSVTNSVANLPPDLLELFNALPEHPPSATSHPQDAMLLHKLLTALDEPVAQRWHWKDTRKVMGSIRVIKDTGKIPSEIIAEQSKVALIPRFAFVSAEWCGIFTSFVLGIELFASGSTRSLLF